MNALTLLIPVLIGLIPSVVFLWVVLSSSGTLGWAVGGERWSWFVSGWGAGANRRSRTIRLHAVLRHLLLITRANLPLDAALRAAAAGETRRVADALNYIAYLTTTGWSVHEALRGAVPGCPPALIALLRNGEQCGQLPGALATIDRMLAERLRPAVDASRHAWTYALFMAVFCVAMGTAFMVFVMPKFVDIFTDFDVALPPITLSLIHIAEAAAAGGMLPGLVMSIILGAGTTAAVVVHRRRAGSDTRPGRIARTVARVRWALPFTRTIDYGLGMATAIRSMALGVRAGLPLDRACTLAPTLGPTNHLRTRLDDFQHRVRNGQRPSDAAHRARLGDVFVAALRMVERGEAPDRALAHAADYYHAMARRWWHALTAAALPCATLVIAAMVAYIALAIFIPIITLINGVAETIT
ncbi:MAG: type II secretion system F family protein [Phycisphaerae bacterium]